MTYHAYENSDWEEPFRCQRQDLTEMNEKLIAFQIDIDQGVPGAAETAEDFKSTTKASLLLARKVKYFSTMTILPVLIIVLNIAKQPVECLGSGNKE